MKKTRLPKLTIAEQTRLRSFRSHEGSGITDPDRFKELMDEAVRLVEPGCHLGDNLFTRMRNLSVFTCRATSSSAGSCSALA